MSRQSCAVCAWREHCNKRFTIIDTGTHCPDFSRDIAIRDIADETEKVIKKKEPNKNDASPDCPSC